MLKLEQRIRNQESRKRSFLKMAYIFILFFIFFSPAANAQCAMCRAALSGDANTEQAQAVNDGIVYLMIIPYLLVAVIGVFIYRMRKNKKKTE